MTSRWIVLENEGSISSPTAPPTPNDPTSFEASMLAYVSELAVAVWRWYFYRVSRTWDMVTRLGNGVWWVNLLGANAYIVDDDGTLTLVDAGFPWSANRLAAALTEVGHSVSNVDRVLVTHYDIDHVGSLGHLETLDATVFVGRADAPLVRRDELPSLSSQKGLFQRAVDWWRATADLPVEPVDDGDRIGGFAAYHTPGHTPGHTVFVSERHDAAFFGDMVMESGGELVPTPWFICRNTAQNHDAIRTLSDRLDAFEIAAVGHGVPFVEGGDRRLKRCSRLLEPDDTRTQ